MSRKLIGKVGVDSGQILIVDPCYLNEYKDDNRNGEAWEPEKHRGEFTYQGVCDVTLTAGYGEIGGGVASMSGWGDGLYPVYANIDEDSGRVTSITIDFK